MTPVPTTSIKFIKNNNRRFILQATVVTSDNGKMIFPRFSFSSSQSTQIPLILLHIFFHSSSGGSCWLIGTNYPLTLNCRCRCYRRKKKIPAGLIPHCPSLEPRHLLERQPLETAFPLMTQDQDCTYNTSSSFSPSSSILSVSKIYCFVVTVM